ncbi:DUF1007 family protein [Aquibium sp. LZ166]|uniref:DUF1007 family protein n=1 Tax=Aquibium pacificus TaxID=3153579 RepID=A0ABV3SCP9_9HYPH
MRPFSRTTVLAATTLAGAALTSPAIAHPHIFAEARLDVMVSPQGDVSSLRHLWRFDDLFSSTVLLEFDANGDLKLDDAELAEVSKTVFDSIGEYDYFQVVRANDKPVTMKPPANLMANYDDGQLVILFESEPADPLKLAGKVDFGVYDPTFYTAIDFVEDANMSIDNLPDGCDRAVIRPDPDEALAQNQSTLTEAFFNDPAGTDYGNIFATKLEITCSGQG